MDWIRRSTRTAWVSGFLFGGLVLSGCGPKAPPRPAGAPPPLVCPDGTRELFGDRAHWCATKKGDKHGPYKSWHINNRKHVEVRYDNGRMDGLYEAWWDDGSTKTEGVYKSGTKDGLWRTWFSGGEKQTEGHYQSGEKHGDWVTWWPTGREESRGAYDAGNRVGPWVFFHQNGYKRAEGEYDTAGFEKDGWGYWDATGEPTTKDQVMLFGE